MAKLKQKYILFFEFEVSLRSTRNPDFRSPLGWEKDIRIFFAKDDATAKKRVEKIMEKIPRSTRRHSLHRLSHIRLK